MNIVFSFLKHVVTDVRLLCSVEPLFAASLPSKESFFSVGLLSGCFLSKYQKSHLSSTL